MLPIDGIIDQQLAEAEAWLAAQEAASLRARHRTVKRHLPGGAGPRSQMLVDTLYRDLAYAAAETRETADITLAFVRHSLRAGPELLAAGWRDLMRKRTLSTLYYIADYQNYVPAQSFLGDLYAEAAGFHDALMLDWRGQVAEATGANFFMVKDGVIHTPTPDCFLDDLSFN